MENTFGESTRQQKVARQIQKDISELFLRECADIVKGVIVSVTAVRVSPDLEYARIYLSIFPFGKHGLGNVKNDPAKIIPPEAYPNKQWLELARNWLDITFGIE